MHAHTDTNTQNNVSLQSAECLFWLFISGLDISVNCENITNFLKSLKEHMRGVVMKPLVR